jgi:hypothetical protein
MFCTCPFCHSSKILCISSARRIAVGAKAVNRLIIRRLSSHPNLSKSPVVLAALEELARRLFDALDIALKIKYQEPEINQALTHVCMRCGRLFGRPHSIN